MRPLLIGMNNPVSSDPDYALYPVPEGCTGNRIWRMLNAVEPAIGKRDYIRAFERVNVLPGKEWNAAQAKRNGRELTAHINRRGGYALIFGAQTRDAMGLPFLAHCEWHQVPFGCAWAWAPHPSGRNPWYNNPFNSLGVGGFLYRMYMDAAQ